MENEGDVSVQFHPNNLDFGCLKENYLYCQNLTITLKNVDLYDLRAYSQKPRAFLHIKIPESINILSVQPIDTHKYILVVGICRQIPDDWKKEKTRLEIFDSEDRMHGENSGKYHKIDVNEFISFTLNDTKLFELEAKAEIYDSQFYHHGSNTHSYQTKIFSSKGKEYLENNPLIGPNYHVNDNEILLLFPTTSNIFYYEERKEKTEEGKEEEGEVTEKSTEVSKESQIQERIEYLDHRRRKYNPRTLDILKLSIYEQRLNSIHPYNYNTILLERAKSLNSKLFYLASIREEECLEECRQIVLEKGGNAGISYILTSKADKSQLFQRWKDRLGLVEFATCHEDEVKRRNFHNVRYESSSLGMSISSFLAPIGFQKDVICGSVLKSGAFSASVVFYDGKENIGVFTRTIYDLLLLGWDVSKFGRLYDPNSQEMKDSACNLCLLKGFFFSFVDEEILRICNKAFDKINDFVLCSEEEESTEKMAELEMKEITSEYFAKKYEIANSEEWKDKTEAKTDDETKNLFADFFERNKECDGLLVPTTKVSALKFGESQLVSNGIEYPEGRRVQLENSLIVSVSGYPCVNIPVGFNEFNNVPVGITIVGRDEKCLFKIIQKLSLIF